MIDFIFNKLVYLYQTMFYKKPTYFKSIFSDKEIKHMYNYDNIKEFMMSVNLDKKYNLFFLISFIIILFLNIYDTKKIDKLTLFSIIVSIYYVINILTRFLRYHYENYVLENRLKDLNKFDNIKNDYDSYKINIV